MGLALGDDPVVVELEAWDVEVEMWGVKAEAWGI